MLNTQQILVVPPFECAWLSGEDFVLRNGKGCISFEVKGAWVPASPWVWRLVGVAGAGD